MYWYYTVPRYSRVFCSNYPTGSEGVAIAGCEGGRCSKGKIITSHGHTSTETINDSFAVLIRLDPPTSTVLVTKYTLPHHDERIHPACGNLVLQLVLGVLV